MLFKNISSVAVAVATLFGTSSSQAVPAIRTIISKWDTTTCAGLGQGPPRQYERGQCFDYYESDHGITLHAVPAGCTLRTFANKGCSGATSKYGQDRAGDCISLQGRWSMRTDC